MTGRAWRARGTVGERTGGRRTRLDDRLGDLASAERRGGRGRARARPQAGAVAAWRAEAIGLLAVDDVGREEPARAVSRVGSRSRGNRFRWRR